MPDLEIDPGETLYMAGVALVVTCLVLYAFQRIGAKNATQPGV